jgi:hypothetical protein
MKSFVAVDSEYSDPEIDSDDYSESLHPSSGFCLEYRDLISTNTVQGEGRFIARDIGVRKMKHSHRRKVIGWMVRISEEMQFRDETVLLGAILFDRVAALDHLDRSELQLYASTCLWIASKMEETLTPAVSDFVYLCGSTYAGAEFVACETHILTLLGFFIASTTPIISAQAALEANGEREGRLADVARFLCMAMLFCPEYGAISPTVVGMTAVVLAALIVGSHTCLRGLTVGPATVMACWREVELTLMEIDDDLDNPFCDAFPSSTGRTLAQAREEWEMVVTESAVRKMCCGQ